MKFRRTCVVFLLASGVLLVTTQLLGQPSHSDQKASQQNQPQQPQWPQVVNTVFADFVAQAPYVHRSDNPFPIFLAIKDGNERPLPPKILGINLWIKRKSEEAFSRKLQVEATEIEVNVFGGTKDDAQPYAARPSDTYTLDLRTKDNKPTEIKVDFVSWTLRVPLNRLAQVLETPNEPFDIKVEFDLQRESDVTIYLRSKLSGPLPHLLNWFRGDTHYHSFYTDTKAEFGLPLEITALMAKSVGLDWITVTDHSDSIPDKGSLSIKGWVSGWKKLAQDIQRLRNEFLFVQAEEVSARSIASQGETKPVCNLGSLPCLPDKFTKENIHLLVYPSPNDALGLKFIESYNSAFEKLRYCDILSGIETNLCRFSWFEKLRYCDIDRPTETVQKVLNEVNRTGGFAYAAHPFDAPSPFIGGAQWMIDQSSGESDYTNTNGRNRRGLAGLEIWNNRSSVIAGPSLTCSGDVVDPYGISSNCQVFRRFDSMKTHIARLVDGMKKGWIPLLRKGLKQYSGCTGDIEKAFISAGSDSHGDFNYETSLDIDSSFFERDSSIVNALICVVAGSQVLTSSFYYSTDNALGKLATIAWCPNGVGEWGENVLKALRDGHTVVSDGPIVVFGIDRDGNGSIDDPDDVHIGDTFQTDKQKVTLSVAWATNEEFGQIKEIRVIRGTADGESSLSPIVPLAGEWSGKR
jgi:hypothetical protein